MVCWYIGLAISQSLLLLLELPQTKITAKETTENIIEKQPNTKLNNLRRKVFFCVRNFRSFIFCCGGRAWQGTSEMKSTVEQLWMLERMLLFLIKSSQLFLFDSLLHKTSAVSFCPPSQMLNEASHRTVLYSSFSTVIIYWSFFEGQSP